MPEPTGEVIEIRGDQSEAEAQFPIDDLINSFGLTSVTNEELHGEEAPEEVVEPAEEEKVEETTEEAKEEAVEPEGEKTETPPPKVEPPPKGFVPTAALREAREELRELKERIKNLEQSKAVPPPVPEEPKSTFKVLTKAEFAELSEESPREALLYMAELDEYKEAQRAQQQKQLQQSQRQAEAERVINESVKLMSEAVPGIFDEGSTVQQELTEFAQEIGFTKDMFYLTNPETLVILPGETEPVYLGSQAASILKMLATTRQKVTAKQDMTAIRKEIEAEMLAKLKTSGGKKFTSLADIPTSKTDPQISKSSVSELEFAKMSKEEQRAYLTGQ